MDNRNRDQLIRIFIVCVFCIPSSLLANQIFVDCNALNDPSPDDPNISDPQEIGSSAHPFDSIQEAIDAAFDGDVIIVSDGVYSGVGNRDIHFRGKAIKVRSQNGPERCIIDCKGSPSERYRGFIFSNDERYDSELDGFTIRNGKASTYGDGGGISGCRNRPTIKNCIITANTAYNGGGMAYCYGPIINCTIVGNTADAGGGTAYCMGDIVNCLIANNTAYSGAGMYRCEGKINSCTIVANYASNSWGGVVFCGNIYNSIVWGNNKGQISYCDEEPSYCCIQDWSEGGLGNINTNPNFVDYNNRDYHLSANSPCINKGNPDYILNYVQQDLDGQPRTIDGCVDIGADEFVCMPILEVTPPNMIVSCLQNSLNPEERLIKIKNIGVGKLNWQINKDSSWLQVIPSSGELSTGNTDEIELAVDIGGLAAGLHGCMLVITTNNALNSPYEAEILLCIRESEHEFYVPDVYPTIQSAIDFADNGDAVILGDGTYKGTGNRDIDFSGKAIIVKSANGAENCIIDCQGTEQEPHRGFTFHRGEDTNSILEGITIINGYGPEEKTGNMTDFFSRGGAIICRGSSPKITKCGFKDNFAQEGGALLIYENSNIELTNCVFNSNYSLGSGGGIFNGTDCEITLRDCIFRENYAGNHGGGICGHRSTYTVLNCDFISNSAKNSGGGAYNLGRTINCRFIGNSARNGGGIFEGSDMKIVNCILNGNSADETGGGIVVSSTASVTNCTFSSNTAGNLGGGAIITTPSSSYKFSFENSIIYENSVNGNFEEKSQIHYWGEENIILSNCCIQGWSGLLNGVHCFDEDPLFYDADGDDNVRGNEDDDLRLSIFSPCIDRGNNNADLRDFGDIDNNGNQDEPVPIDIGGTRRFIDIPWVYDSGIGNSPIVDLGAYETEIQQSLIISQQPVIVPEGDSGTFFVSLALDPITPVQVQINAMSGDPDIILESTNVLNFDSSNFQIPQAVVLFSKEDNDHFNSSAIFKIDIPNYLNTLITVTEADNEPYVNRLLVDSRAKGRNDGSDWENAFINLQDAISSAQLIPEVNEIWIAQGTYSPNAKDLPEPQEASFILLNDVAIKGGFAGLGEEEPDKRDTKKNKSVLSGDLNNNDSENFSDYNDNCYHVVTSIKNNIFTTLDGVTISGGNATSENLFFPGGGGLLCQETNMKFVNCTFAENMGKNGGAVFNHQSRKAVFEDCIFINNYAKHTAGALFNNNSKQQIARCIFYKNFSFYGGALSGTETNYTLENCTFIGNDANRGGALFIDYNCQLILKNCIFSGNTSKTYGGAVYTLRGGAEYFNCTFSGNYSNNYGGAIFTYNSSDPTFIQCIFWNNWDKNGDSDSSQLRFDFQFTKPIINYCCFPGPANPYAGTGLIYADPMFIDANGIDNIMGTLDDNLRLFVTSPCIDNGDPNYITTVGEVDLDGKPRVLGDKIDIGAYECRYVESDMWFTPKSLNAKSKGKWLKAHFVLPETYCISDVDVNKPAELYPIGIKSEKLDVFSDQEGLTRITAFFERNFFYDTVNVELEAQFYCFISGINGEIFYGQSSILTGSKYLDKVANLISYWLETNCQNLNGCEEFDQNHDGIINFLDFAGL